MSNLNEIFKSLEGLENGSEIINAIKDERSRLNSEAEKLRKERNVLLSHNGIDSSTGITLESLNQKLAENKKQEEAQKAQLDELLKKHKDKENQNLSELEKLQNTVSELTRTVDDSNRKLAEKERAERLGKLNHTIRGNLQNAGVDPLLIDDLAESIKAKTQEVDGKFVYMSDAGPLEVAQGVAKHIENKTRIFVTQQKPGSGSNTGSGDSSGELTPDQRREKLRSLRKKY